MTSFMKKYNLRNKEVIQYELDKLNKQEKFEKVKLFESKNRDKIQQDNFNLKNNDEKQTYEILKTPCGLINSKVDISQTNVLKIFKILDRNDLGYFDIIEFNKLGMKMGFIDTSITQIFNEIDLNGDKSIKQFEWVEFIRRLDIKNNLHKRMIQYLSDPDFIEYLSKDTYEKFKSSNEINDEIEQEKKQREEHKKKVQLAANRIEKQIKAKHQKFISLAKDQNKDEVVNHRNLIDNFDEVENVNLDKNNNKDEDSEDDEESNVKRISISGMNHQDKFMTFTRQDFFNKTTTSFDSSKQRRPSIQKTLFNPSINSRQQHFIRQTPKNLNRPTTNNIFSKIEKVEKPKLNSLRFEHNHHQKQRLNTTMEPVDPQYNDMLSKINNGSALASKIQKKVLIRQ